MESSAPRAAKSRVDASVATLGPDDEEPTAATPPVSLERGQAFGRYVVIEKVGAGGMGVVYAAYDPELDRRVALKVVKPGHGSRGSARARQRLVREAQAMAQLAHPNVVTIHDVGIAHGRVYLTMEFIEGLTLARWAAEKPRPLRERLDVLIAAGAGLVAAHEKQLVHRDFKPENVMIGNDGRVRVTDFGLVAQHWSEDSESRLGSSSSLTVVRSDLTQDGAMIGTPAYMAPEQFERGRTGPKSDQFSFCVTAWELLYGVRPFPGDTPMEIIRAVTEGGVTDEAPLTGVPRYVRRALLRGLALDPDERWPYLEQPLEVLRRDPGRRRRRTFGIVGMSAIVVGSVAAVEVADAFEAAECDAEAAAIADVYGPDRRRDLERAMLDTGAPFAGSTSERVLAFLDDYVQRWGSVARAACLGRSKRTKQSSSAHALCLHERKVRLDATAEELAEPTTSQLAGALRLVHGLPRPEACDEPGRIEREFSDAASREDRTLDDALVRALVKLRAGDSERAASLASALATEARAADRDALALDADALHGSALSHLGQADDAEALLSRTLFGAGALGLDELGFRCAELLLRLETERDRYEAAHRWDELAEMFLRRLDARNERLTASLLAAEATLASAEGDFDRAHERYTEALALREELSGPNAPEVVRVRRELGAVAVRDGDVEAGARMLEDALAHSVEAYGEEHPEVARTRNKLASALTASGRYDEAYEQMHLASITFRSFYGEDHPQSAKILANLGTTAYLRDDFAGARDTMLEAMPRLEAAFGKDSPTLVNGLNTLAAAYDELGDPARARAQHVRSLGILRASVGVDHPLLVQTLVNLANSTTRIGEFSGVDELYSEALGIQERRFGEVSSATALILLERGKAAREAGRPQDARRFHAEALRRVLAATEISPPDLRARIAAALGDDELALRRFAAARDRLDEALSLGATDVAKLSGRRRQVALLSLAEAHWQLGDPQPARTAANEAKALQGTPALERGRQKANDWLQTHR